MNIIILQDNSLKGRYGLYSALDPVSLPDGTFMLPERCLSDKDLAEVRDLMIQKTQTETAILDLPEIGEQCVKGVIYKLPPDLVDEELSPNVVCVQTHDRTIYNPKDTPALFSFFRENTDELAWIPNEWVEVGWKRIYEGTIYEVIQAHQTQSDWTPDVVAALWKAVTQEEPPGENPCEGVKTWDVNDHWTTYSVGDRRIDEGKLYECHNVGFSYHKPSGAHGHHGWTYIQDCS